MDKHGYSKDVIGDLVSSGIDANSSDQYATYEYDITSSDIASGDVASSDITPSYLSCKNVFANNNLPKASSLVFFSNNARATKLGYSTSHDDYDSSISVHAYLTVYYNQASDGTYLLTSLAGHWVVEDSTVSVTKSLLSYGCSSITVTQKNIDKAVTNNFSVSTGFTKYINSTIATMGGRLDLSLKHASSTWIFELEDNVFSNSSIILN